ncbi:MAG: hypothetical protein ACR650_06510 [Methylocystis sp.]|jgi:hypothetical protein
MSDTRETLSALVDRDILDAVREMARDEGKELQTVVEDALREHLAHRAKPKTRHQVMEAFRKSLADYDSLYEKLAK